MDEVYTAVDMMKIQNDEVETYTNSTFLEAIEQRRLLIPRFWRLLSSNCVRPPYQPQPLLI